MIDLRWYTREKNDGGVETVLQFRREAGPRGEGWWGDWQDVPRDASSGAEAWRLDL